MAAAEEVAALSLGRSGCSKANIAYLAMGSTGLLTVLLIALSAASLKSHEGDSDGSAMVEANQSLCA